jgi:hypothetical protein
VNRCEPTGGSACPNAANQVVRVSRDMRTDWVNFASTGNPGCASYDPNTRSTRVYTAEPTTQPHPEGRSTRIRSTHRFDTLHPLPKKTRRRKKPPRSVALPYRPVSCGAPVHKAYFRGLDGFGDILNQDVSNRSTRLTPANP